MFKFLLPDVASTSIACFKFVSVHFSVTFTVVEEDKANKIQIELIDASDEVTETLNLYCVTNNTLSFLLHIYIYEMYSYIFISVSMLEMHF